jgi:hypothetical protein
MGYGGDLLLSAVIRDCSQQYKKPVELRKIPRFSDVLRLKLSDQSYALTETSVLFGNPHVLSNQSVVIKGSLSRWIDRLGTWCSSRFGFRSLAEELLLFYSKWAGKYRSSVPFYIDLQRLSYAEKDFPDRIIWKSGGHATEIASREMGLIPSEKKGEIFFVQSETARVSKLMSELKLLRGKFIVVEPHTNAEWFGDLRSWSFENWVLLMKKTQDLGIRWIQVGLPQSHLIPGAESICGQLSFRETAYLINQSMLFMGTEGGLMHAARAVGSHALILWGGLTPLSLTGYPDHQKVVSEEVECSPCGLKGNCPYQKKCMTGISVEKVENALRELVKSSI